MNLADRIALAAAAVIMLGATVVFYRNDNVAGVVLTAFLGN